MSYPSPQLMLHRPFLIATLLMASIVIGSCTSNSPIMDKEQMNAFATKYTAAWCSQNAASVADHFASNGSLKINAGEPAVGQEGITRSAQAFMTAFPDMVVRMDSLVLDEGRTEYHWTLTGTNTGPGGSGKPVHISGYEEWTMGDYGLIQASLGHFDEAEYARQLE